ncbi:biliverdin-producing heme oxygenase [Silvimonas amylolytica]|uniref:Heme oxygenase n=1 Tax=Silvimonas amylolytica TaxID=449663 RepID=A0ABQ2PKU4_9NEIS|nr:biliverdin-producing heme oxygenase [Silvimonas amylolytica]GGP26072.1 heme oxygenase [Silvimonas amylolytica]
MSLRHHLRDATQPLHARLDQLLAAHAFDSSASYSHFLKAQAAALIPLELALEAAGIEDELPDWPVRRRREALLGDLYTLDAALPALMPQPALAPDQSRWGALYVLEGSRLGAAVLLRRLQTVADGRMQTASRYLSHGAGSSLWPDFVRQLESLSPVQTNDVVAGAQHAFRVFIAAAQRYPVSAQVPD